jgi:signal transduction histidine kinase
MPVIEKEKIDLAQKIENIVKLYENLENIEVKAIIKHRPVYIWADNKQISRVFINLIKNAVQAIPEGIEGKVIVELDVKDDKALVKVVDNGTGIPEDVRSKLFTPSFTTKSSGMGLGLAMVKNIIVNSEGRIWFDTEVGKGTTFYIEFPLYNEKSDKSDKTEE